MSKTYMIVFTDGSYRHVPLSVALGLATNVNVVGVYKINSEGLCDVTKYTPPKNGWSSKVEGGKVFHTFHKNDVVLSAFSHEPGNSSWKPTIEGYLYDGNDRVEFSGEFSVDKAKKYVEKLIS